MVAVNRRHDQCDPGKRIEAIYEADRGLPLRKSHENPAVKTLYEEFLGKPLGEKSHRLLHTHYTKRGNTPKHQGNSPIAPVNAVP